MAKIKSLSKKKHDTGRTITTKSVYGSHADMVENASDFGLTLGDNQVLCKDDDGYYITLKDRLDTGLADPYRTSFKRLNLTKQT